MGEKKSKHGSQKQYICDQLVRMKRDGHAELNIGAARLLIKPVATDDGDGVHLVVALQANYDDRNLFGTDNLYVVRCKRGYAIAELTGYSGKRFQCMTRTGETFWISARDVLAAVKKQF